ncbi:MAG: transposase [Deltaproteobacteria bacterium]|nr:transposase [Deltaproteobacteria bacterium]
MEPKRRRRFTAAEKLRILKAADAAVSSGKRGALEALLRREAIYSSHLSHWRQQMAARGTNGLSPQKPGRKPKLDDKDGRLLALSKQNAELERKLRIANALIGLQEKAHEILGIALPEHDEES